MCASVSIRPSDAVGVYQSVNTGVPVVAFCKHCGNDLYYSANGGFRIVRGKCDCDWKCCEFSQSGAQRHGEHIAYRKAPPEIKELVRGRKFYNLLNEVEWALASCYIKDRK